MKFIIAALLINSHQQDNPNSKPDNQPTNVDGRMQPVAENISPGDFEVIKKHSKKLSVTIWGELPHASLYEVTNQPCTVSTPI